MATKNYKDLYEKKKQLLPPSHLSIKGLKSPFN